MIWLVRDRSILVGQASVPVRKLQVCIIAAKSTGDHVCTHFPYNPQLITRLLPASHLLLTINSCINIWRLRVCRVGMPVLKERVYGAVRISRSKAECDR